MRPLTNILCVIDGPLEETSALTIAAELAVSTDAKLTIAYSSDYDASMPPDTDGNLADHERWSHVRSHWRQELERLAQPIRDKGVVVDLRIHDTLPFLEIIQSVLRDGHDLVVKNPQSTRGVKYLLFGSADLHLLRKCPCPVWIHQGPYGPGYRRVLAAFDLMTRSDEERQLNELITEFATSLPKNVDCELHAVHAWDQVRPNASRTRTFKRGIDNQLSPELQLELDMRFDAFDQLLSSYRKQGHRVQEHVIQGDARIVIPEFAMTYGVDLIVMGTIGRTGLPGFLIGNTAEDIIRQVECSVVAIKPSGFITPIVSDEDAYDSEEQQRPMKSGARHG